MAKFIEIEFEEYGVMHKCHVNTNNIIAIHQGENEATTKVFLSNHADYNYITANEPYDDFIKRLLLISLRSQYV